MRRVLLVDDEELLRQGLLGMFDWEAGGYTVVGQAANGAEALAMVADTAPDIVITDVKMPVMDGVALTEQLRRQYPAVRTIVLSSFNDFDYVRKTLLGGAVDYILKPRLNRELLHKALASAEACGQPPRSVPAHPDAAFYAACQAPPDAEMIFAPSVAGWKPATARDLADRGRYRDAVEYLRDCAAAAITGRQFPTALALREACGQVYGLLFVHVLWLGKEPEARALRRRGQAQLAAAGDYARLFPLLTGLCEQVETFVQEVLRGDLGKVLAPVWLYLWEHYDQELNLANVAEHFYMNKSYLCQLFRRHCDTSFGALLGDIRIYKAKQLLADPGLGVQAVARQVGYATPGYFAKQFRRSTGYTPSEYQQSVAAPGAGGAV